MTVGGVACVVEFEARSVVNSAAAHQIVAATKRMPTGAHLIVVAKATTEEARNLLEEAGIGFLDLSGNMRIHLPGLFVWAQGGRGHVPAGKQADGSPLKLSGKAGVAALALLCDPAREWRVQDLVQRAFVSAGLAHRLLARLEREGIVRATAAGPRKTRQLTNRSALLDLWAEEMKDRGKQLVRGYRLARDPRAQARTLSRLLDQANVEHAVSGAAGAAMLVPSATAIPVTDIWVTENAALQEVLAELKAERVESGHNLALRQAADDTPLAFRQQIQGVWVANTFRLYFDLRQDPRRGPEQADRIREEVIRF